MQNYKIYLTIIDHKPVLNVKPEILIEQTSYNLDTDYSESLFFNEDGSISERIIEDALKNIMVFDDPQNGSMSTTKFFYDDKGRTTKDIEYDENDEAISETNYEYDADDNLVRQEYKEEGEVFLIKFFYEKERNKVSSEHFTNGKLTMIQKKEMSNKKHISFSMDENDRQIQKWIRFLDENGIQTSESEYDENDKLVKIFSNYYDKNESLQYATNYDLAENKLTEFFYDYKSKDEINTRIEKYYEDMELVLEKIYRYEYSNNK